MQMVVDISLPETLLYRQSPNPIAMKAVRHPVGEVNGGQWLVCDIFGVENDQVAPIFPFAVHSHEQKAFAFG